MILLSFTLPVCAQSKEDTILKKLDDLQKTLNVINDDIQKKIEKNSNDIKELFDIVREIKLNNSKKVVPKVDAYKSTLKGRVKFVNTYHMGYVVMVNQTSYFVRSGGTITVENITPGDFSYQVIGVTPKRLRTLLPDETFTVTIHP